VPVWDGEKFDRIPIPETAKTHYCETTGEADRLMVVHNVTGHLLYEIFQARWNAASQQWESCGSRVYDDRTSDSLQPDGSPALDGSCSDSGLSVYAGAVKWPEMYGNSKIDHAICGGTWKQRGWKPPARGGTPLAPGEAWAPPEGTRLRLKKNYDIMGFSLTTQALLLALMKYGIILTDSGGGYNLTLSGVHDERWPAGSYHYDQQMLRTIPVTEFEAVEEPAVYTGTTKPGFLTRFIAWIGRLFGGKGIGG
jgi:hypothetical protein